MGSVGATLLFPLCKSANYTVENACFHSMKSVQVTWGLLNTGIPVILLKVHSQCI